MAEGVTLDGSIEPAPTLRSRVQHQRSFERTDDGVLELIGHRIAFTSDKHGRVLDAPLAEVEFAFAKLVAAGIVVKWRGQRWYFAFAVGYTSDEADWLPQPVRRAVRARLGTADRPEMPVGFLKGRKVAKVWQQALESHRAR